MVDREAQRLIDAPSRGQHTGRRRRSIASMLFVAEVGGAAVACSAGADSEPAAAPVPAPSPAPPPGGPGPPPSPPPPAPPSPPPPGSADFASRCAQSGVIKCVGFDDAASIAGKWGDPSGTTAGDSAAPTIDTAFRASGAGSLKFTIRRTPVRIAPEPSSPTSRTICRSSLAAARSSTSSRASDSARS